ncbi:45 kDa calcium-binding protein-like isoform X3 [Artemia franciscana]|uniref:45 kDa calcium-binding protein-like isoform X3 n=1 Tax=Artemia franciscana TaxID=6661 RepID=UPI0032D9FD9B
MLRRFVCRISWNKGLIFFIVTMLFGLFALVRLSVRTTQNIDEYENEGYTLSKEEEELLLALFPRVDVNNDHLWSLEEMEKWISQRVRDHVRAAMKDNVFLFTKIDRSPRDGRVDWKEYTSWFLTHNGYKDDKLLRGRKSLSRKIKEQLAWNKAQWSEATRSNTSSLDLDEFLSFLHPESSVATLLDRVDNVILQLDHDSDGFLRWDEFTFVTSRTISIQDYFSEYELQRFQNKYSLKKEFSIADKDKSDTIDRGLFGSKEPKTVKARCYESFATG